MTDPTDGSAAASAGLAIMTGLEKLWLVYQYINSTRDMLANHQVSGSHTAAQIISGVLDEGRIPRVLPGNLKVDTLGIGGTGMGFDSAGTVYGANLHSFGTGQIDGPLINSYARANGVSGGLSIYVRADGVIGIAASSRRFKKEIKAASIDLQAVLALQVVQFRYRAAIDPAGDVQVGLIAEDLHDLGLTWLVAYDDDGLPLTVHYEKLALALVPVIQDHEARISKLEAQRA